MHIIFDLRLGRFDILIERWNAKVPFKVSREGVGEVTVDFARFRVILTNHSRRRQAVM